MTVRGRHLRNLRMGVKRLELRKTRPRGDTPRRVWICESGSCGHIMAVFTCPRWEDVTEAPEGELAARAVITRAEVRGYREQGSGRLYGWVVEDFEWLKGTDRERHVVDFGLDRPPQSWCYAKEATGDV